jgi:hypothetical protein
VTSEKAAELVLSFRLPSLGSLIQEEAAVSLQLQCENVRALYSYSQPDTAACL